MRRGQITVFIIIGIVVLLLFGLVSYLLFKTAPEEFTRQEALTEAERSVQKFVADCVRRTTEEAVVSFGWTGGVTTPLPFPFYYRIEDKYIVPYYYADGESYAPTPGFAERVLALYVDQHLLKCTDYSKMPYNITVRATRTAARLGKDSADFEVRHEVTVTTPGRTTRLPPVYASRIPGRLVDMLGFAFTLANKAVDNDILIHWDYLADIAKQDYNATAYREDANTVVYKIIDLRNEVLREPVVLQFAAKVQT
ncbi:hypothetical protein HY642_07370 [Candidatus Woesearchaeota archaeon]|nr:hypothetical protein [Candidatus Woesearchaeota archaeon]